MSEWGKEWINELYFNFFLKFSIWSPLLQSLNINFTRISWKESYSHKLNIDFKRCGSPPIIWACSLKWAACADMGMNLWPLCEHDESFMSLLWLSAGEIFVDSDFSVCVCVWAHMHSKQYDDRANKCLFWILQNGVLLRTVLDPVTGDLSDTRTRYLGSRPVKLFRVRMQGQEAVSTNLVALNHNRGK